MMALVPVPLNALAAGHGMMILCCLFYLAWWCVAFRPGAAASPFGWRAWIPLLLAMGTAGCGILLNAYGVDALETGDVFLSKQYVCAIGAVSYAALLLATTKLFHRPATSELLLMVAWAVMEAAVVRALHVSGHLAGHQLLLAMAALATAAIIGLLAYMLYYDLDERTAYICGMAPLVADAASMGVLMAFMLHAGQAA